ncbi:hypothetical protein PMZ80_001264 [Knufia obscura]|uniref:Uncharacterized protein n=2 Tax=Knufia TaxID=430999 RepID=A0AAN8IB19_9EURO|nr:hypothetical protein PMZ80_001264 [Knufia obscura]KAK5956330.1 hypothetical protein OHC33_002906 [Knufia fluminis]
MSCKTTTTPKLEPYSDRSQLMGLLKGQVFGTIPAVTAANMTNPEDVDRTIIITGANTGLGFEAAKQFLQLGCVSKLVLACRSLEKGEKAKMMLQGINAGESTTAIEVWGLDMASTASIVAFAERTSRELSRIDAIVLNAGVELVSYERASHEDGGYEMTLMVNVVGTFLLATLMVPVLRGKGHQSRSAARPRIVIVGSQVQFVAKYDVLLEAGHKQSGEGILKWLSDESRWNGKITKDRYYLSKGIVQLLERQLAGIIEESSKAAGKELVIVNCVCPGACRTDLFRTSGNAGSKMALKLIGRDGDVGARALVVGAIGKEGDEGSHGQFLTGGVVTKCSSWCETKQGERVGKQIWEEVSELVEKVQPGTMARL